MTEPTYKPFPLINLSLVDTSEDAIVRQYIHHGNAVLHHRPFPVNTLFDIFGASQCEANREWISQMDTLNLGDTHELVIRTEDGGYETREVVLTKTHDDTGNDRIVQFGGPAVGIMGEINIETGSTIITSKDPNIVAIFLQGDRRDPSYLPTETPIVEAPAFEGTTLKQMLPELELAEQIAGTTLSDVSAAMADSHISVDDAIDTVAAAGYVALRGTNAQECLEGLIQHFDDVGYEYEIEGSKDNESWMFRLIGDFRLVPADTTLITLRAAVRQIEKLWVGKQAFELTLLRSPDDVTGRIRLIDNRQQEFLISIGATERWDEGEFDSEQLDLALEQLGETLNALAQIRHGADFRLEIIEAEGIEVTLPVAPWEVVGHSAPGTRLVVGIPQNANPAVEGFDARAAMLELGLPEVTVVHADLPTSLVIVDDPTTITSEQLALQLTFSGDERVYVLLKDCTDTSILQQVQQWFASYLNSYLTTDGRLYSVETNTGETMLANQTAFSASQLGPYWITIKA